MEQSFGGACNLDVHAANRHPYTFQIEFPDGGGMGSVRSHFEGLYRALQKSVFFGSFQDDKDWDWAYSSPMDCLESVFVAVVVVVGLLAC